jgi:hypothetical protein
VIVQDVITRVLRQFGDEASVQIENADIIRWINDCAKEVAVQNDLGQTTAIQSSVIGQNLYTLQSDTLAIRSIYYDKKKLDFYARTEYDAYVNTVDPKEDQSGTPILYTRHVNDILLYPKPDAVKDIKVWYFQRPTQVVNTTDTLPFAEEYHLRIVEYCLQQAYQTDEDWDAAERMKGQFDDGMTRLKQLEDADDEEFYPTITVLPDDGGYYY